MGSGKIKRKKLEICWYFLVPPISVTAPISYQVFPSQKDLPWTISVSFLSPILYLQKPLNYRKDRLSHD